LGVVVVTMVSDGDREPAVGGVARPHAASVAAANTAPITVWHLMISRHLTKGIPPPATTMSE
jgi:hypothetical protein